jgi:hypothetical protein
LTELSNKQLRTRLDALYENLAEFPPGLPCSWQVSRLFNELLKHTKQVLPEDPIVNSVAQLKHPGIDADASSVVQIGTVRTIVAQLRVALDGTGSES